jgi:preprotein translocase subunit SecD
MLEFPRWKYVLVTLVVLIGLLFTLPNLFGEDPALQVERKNRAPMDNFARQSIEELLRKQSVTIKRDYIESGRLILAFDDVASQLKARDTVDATLSDVDRSALANATREPSWMRGLGLKAMPLGLDLRGGLYLLYQVDLQGAINQLLDSYEQSVRRALNEAKVPFTDITTITASGSTVANGLRVSLPADGKPDAVEDIIHTVDATLRYSSSSTAAGPVVDLVLTPAQIKAREDYALEQNRTTLSNRVNELGVSEPIVQRQGLDRINVQLPGVQNSAEVKDLLGKVATLEMRLVDQTGNAMQAEQSGRAPLGTKLYKREDGSPILLKREVIVTGDEITSATSAASQEGPAVSIRLDARGAESKRAVARSRSTVRRSIVRPTPRRSSTWRRSAGYSARNSRSPACPRARRAIWRCYCDPARWPRRSRWWRSAPSARAWVRTISTRACTRSRSACWRYSYSWRCTTTPSDWSPTWCCWPT